MISIFLSNLYCVRPVEIVTANMKEMDRQLSRSTDNEKGKQKMGALKNIYAIGAISIYLY